MSGLPPVEASPAALDALPWAVRTGRHLALGHDFALRTTDALVGRYLEQVLAPLAVTGSPRRLYSAVSPPYSPPGSHILYLDRTCAMQASDQVKLCRAVLIHVNQEAIAGAHDHALVHASAAEDAGRALLFPGPPECGKTTMVAGVVRAGLRYVTDEAVAIRHDTLLVDPYPKWLALDPGSWPLFPELRPRLSPDLEFFAAAQWHVDPRRIRPTAVAPSCLPGLIVALRFTEDGGTDLSPISRAEALAALVDNAFNLRRQGRRGFQTLAEVVAGSGCFRLETGDLGRAVDLIIELVEAQEWAVGENRRGL